MSLARAIETGDLTALPSRRDEDWRWTDLRGLVRSLPPASPANDTALPPGPFEDLGESIIKVNGGGPERLAIESGERRIVALRFIAGAGAGAHVARFSVDIADGAELTLLESYEGAGDGYLTEAGMSIDLGRGARLERIVMARDGADAISVSLAEVTLAAGARLAQTILTSGAKRQRLETRVIHPGGGARVRLDGVYRLAERRHADITTLVTHAGVDGATDQLVKGVVHDQARGVFQGRIVVLPGADRTDARMGHHALVLSDRAEVDAKPELEIYADDVACAHGNTVGALDEEALFYARQRGIPEAAAKAMLTEAFLAEVIDRIGHDGARDVAHAWLASRLKAAP
ncbi:MAG TPA: Fe-S cluster assembly protein SufD [Caulobacteraceae bacterium]|nr:Fe-S cluster assembly protein SufD [Caulobacteraceae bacterium]